MITTTTKKQTATKELEPPQPLKIACTLSVNMESVYHAISGAWIGYAFEDTPKRVAPTEPFIRYEWDKNNDADYLYPGGALIFKLNEDSEGVHGYKVIDKAVREATLKGEDSPSFTLDLEAIKRGLRKMAKEEPEEFVSNFLGDRFNMDGPGGFDFLQDCLFGENIFG